MKYYDRYLSKINTNIKSILLVLVVFVVGFLSGYLVGGGDLFNSHTPKEDSNNTAVVNKVN